MTRRWQPDDVAARTALFPAPTLAEALAAARAAHGPQATVVRALRVRRGVRGLLGREHYEVHVLLTDDAAASARGRREEAPPSAPEVPRPGSTPRRPAAAPGPAPGDVLRDLVAAADRSEADGSPVWSWTGASDVASLLEEVAGRQAGERGGDHPAPELARHPAPDLARHAAVDLGRRTAAGAETGGWRELLVDALGAPEPPTTPGPRRAPRGGWDRSALRALGVPPAVLRRLPAEDPSDDAGWRLALREAIAAVVPPPAEPTEETPVVVSGYGVDGVVAVLRAAVEEGCPPGTIGLDGRRRPATAAALVEVLAACVRP